ncbi:MAG TPA: FecR domain-containing protein [Polyangiaceae bacterium]|nr:FecR domain-containing protein [Polyangiaceae bacterium]
MTDPASRALKQLRGGVAPVLDEPSERARRERIAARVVEVSRELTAQRERRRRFGFGLALAAIVGGVAAVLLWVSPGGLLAPGGLFHPEGSEPAALAASEVRLVAGHASLRDAAGVENLMPGEHALADSALLVTAPEESAELLLTSDTAVSVAPASQVGISRQKPAPDVFEERVRLRAGRVALRVPKLGTRGKVSVETPDALVEVHGTQFSVQIVEDSPRERHTEVRVREGRVLVRSGEQSRFLGAGDSWSSRAEAASPPTPPPAVIEPQPAAALEPAAPDEPAQLERPEKAAKRPAPRARRAPRTPSPASELAAQNRLLEAAELAQKNGLPSLAIQRLDALIARYPDAELAHNARVERFRVLNLAGRRSEAQAAARAYLDHHPYGFARAEAERLLEEPAAP